MNSQPTRKELSHDRIVEAAARAIRQHGYAGVGVADVMKDAGLTHGGFYAHLASRDALLVEAIERAGRGSSSFIGHRIEALREAGASPFRALVESYLDDRLLKALDADPAEVVGFRYRGNGWPGFATAVLRDGTERKMSYHDSWGKVLSKHVQHRCKICADGTGIAADIIVLSVYAAAAARGGRFMAAGPLAVWRERVSGGALILVGGALSLVKRAA